LLAIASASTTHSLSDISGVVSTVTVTAAYPDAGVAPVLTALTYTTTYDSSATNLALFTITGAATFTANNTIQGGYLVLTNGGDTVNVFIIASQPISGSNAVTLSGGGYPKFLNTGNYAASVTLTTAIQSTYSVTLSTAFTAVAATKYTPPAISSFNLVSPQNGGCDAISCDNSINGTIAFTPAIGTGWFTYLRSSHATTGVLFGTQAGLTAGAANFNTDTFAKLATTVGGVVNGVFETQLIGISSATHIPQGDNFAISGLLVDGTSSRTTWFSEAVVGVKQASVTISTGSTDVTAPTCTAVTVSPTTISTVAAPVSVTITVICGDETGGSGLWTSGYFATASITNGNAGSVSLSDTVDPNTHTTTQPIGPYVSGSITVVGVFAIDNAGNAALYGSCGGNTGFDTLGCSGGGSSSASTVAFSLFSVLLAMLVLLA